MIPQIEVLKKLRDFGLNSYESKLWTALLSRGISTAGELSDIANVPRSRSYDVLESLEKKGFIIMKLGKPIKYIAVSPSEVLERIKKKVKEDAERQAKSIDNLKKSSLLVELSSLHSNGLDLVEPSSLSGSFKGRNNLYNHLEIMIKNSKKSITILTTEEGIARKSKHLWNHIRKAKERGVKVRIGVPPMKQTTKALQSFRKIADIRQISGFSARLMMTDEKEITFMVMDDKDVHPTYDVGIWVNSPLFVGALSSMFHKIWQGAKKAPQ